MSGKNTPVGPAQAVSFTKEDAVAIDTLNKPFDFTLEQLNTMTEDSGLSASLLDDKYNSDGDGEHPIFLRKHWREAVAQEHTVHGYWDWAREQIVCYSPSSNTPQRGSMRRMLRANVARLNSEVVSASKPAAGTAQDVATFLKHWKSTRTFTHPRTPAQEFEEFVGISLEKRVYNGFENRERVGVIDAALDAIVEVAGWSVGRK
jgi:hypothetical protein